MPKKKDVQSRVRWNTDEKNALLEAARNLLASDPGLKLLRAVEQAQTVLEEARRRTITQISQVPWFVQGLKSGAAPARRSTAAPAAAPRAAASSPSARVPVEDIVAGIKEAVADTLATILARVFDRVERSAPAQRGAAKRGRPAKKKAKAAKRARK